MSLWNMWYHMDKLQCSDSRLYSLKKRCLWVRGTIYQFCNDNYSCCWLWVQKLESMQRLAKMLRRYRTYCHFIFIGNSPSPRTHLAIWRMLLSYLQALFCIWFVCSGSDLNSDHTSLFPSDFRSVWVFLLWKSSKLDW